MTGRSGIRLRTISIKRAMASESATEVPPNLAMIIQSVRLSEELFLPPPEARRSEPPVLRHPERYCGPALPCEDRAPGRGVPFRPSPPCRRRARGPTETADGRFAHPLPRVELA